jgi:hypothetical protein
MTDALKEAIEVLLGLSESEQETAARAIIDFASRDEELRAFED